MHHAIVIPIYPRRKDTLVKPKLALGVPMRPFKSKHVQISRDQRVAVFGWSAEPAEWGTLVCSPDGSKVEDESESYLVTLQKALYICALEVGDRPAILQLSPSALVQLWTQLWFRSKLVNLRKLRHHTVATRRTPEGKVPTVQMSAIRPTITVEWKNVPSDFGTGWRRLQLAGVHVSPAYCGISCVATGS